MASFILTDYRIILDLGVLLLAALFVGAVFKRLGMPPTLGMLITGIIIGPFTPGFQVVSEDIITMGQIGAILILFGAGLQFRYSTLSKFGLKGFSMAAFSGTMTFIAGSALGLLLGWSISEILILGVLFMSTSTIMALRMLEEIPHARSIKAESLTKAAIVTDDLLGLLALALVLGMTRGVNSSMEVGLSTLGMLLVILLIFIVGVKAMPKIAKLIDKAFPGNAFAFGISFCLILSYGVVTLGISPLIGAFLAGTILTSTLKYKDVLRSMIPIRNLFAPVFFVSVGLLIDPYLLIIHMPVALLISAVAVFSKALAFSALLILSGVRFKNSLVYGMFTGPRGEISLVIAQTALLAGLVEQPFLAIATSLVLFTTIISPLVIRGLKYQRAKLT